MVRQPAIPRRAAGFFKRSVATIQGIPARTRAAQPHSLIRALSDGPKRSPKAGDQSAPVRFEQTPCVLEVLVFRDEVAGSAFEISRIALHVFRLCLLSASSIIKLVSTMTIMIRPLLHCRCAFDHKCRTGQLIGQPLNPRQQIPK